MNNLSPNIVSSWYMNFHHTVELLKIITLFKTRVRWNIEGNFAKMAVNGYLHDTNITKLHMDIELLFSTSY